jgi:Arc/MetJ-type ribon-helix-helix transcriptional regulator
MVTLNVDIPEEMDAQIRQICQDQHCSPDEAIRDVLRRWIARQRFGKLAADTEKHARAAGFSSEDDILGAVS